MKNINNMICVIVLFNLIFFLECSAANSKLSASEILDKYTQALDPIESFIGTSESILY